MDYIKKWLTPINTLIIIGLFIAVLAGKGDTIIVPSDNERSAGQTRISGMSVGADGLSVSGSSSFTGAMTSSNNTFTQGGVIIYRDTQAFDTATTTVCSLQAPSATSTLTNAAVTFDVSSTTASVVTLAKATTAFATTTQIGLSYTIEANAEATIMASTSPAAGDALIFAPSEWFVVGMQNGVGNFSPSGDCWASWSTTN